MSEQNMPRNGKDIGFGAAGDDAGINPATIEKLRDWIVAAKPQTIQIDLDTDLIGNGALDSLHMVNFLLFIEEMREKEIPEALIQPRYFGSLRVIYDTFFSN
jgi:acyl carrier protein